jgi:hypothetical protein
MSNELQLPDFEDMYKLLEEINALGVKKLLMSEAIDLREAEIILEVSTDGTYYVNGKPPTMTFINKTYLRKGLKGNLPKMREQLARVTAEYEYAKKKFDLDKIAIDVWRTQSANKRKVID